MRSVDPLDGDQHVAGRIAPAGRARRQIDRDGGRTVIVVNLIGSGSAVQRIRTRAAAEVVVPCPAQQRICPGIAAQDVPVVAALQPVIGQSAFKPVETIPAIKAVIAIIAAQEIVSRTALDGVVPGAPEHHLFAGSADDRVGRCVADADPFGDRSRGVFTEGVKHAVRFAQRLGAEEKIEARLGRQRAVDLRDGLPERCPQGDKRVAKRGPEGLGLGRLQGQTTGGSPV